MIHEASDGAKCRGAHRLPVIRRHECPRSQRREKSVSTTHGNRLRFEMRVDIGLDLLEISSAIQAGDQHVECVLCAVLKLVRVGVCQHRVVGIVQIGIGRTRDRPEKFCLKTGVGDDNARVQRVDPGEKVGERFLYQVTAVAVIRALVEVVHPVAASRATI